MSYRAIYTYAWDLADEGLEHCCGHFEGLGLNTVTLAGAYHAGKFLRPHGRSGKVFFPQDGTVYFKPAPGYYGKIKPVESSLLKERDYFKDLPKANKLKFNAWMVLLHNTLIGSQHPECCVTNAFGDRYVYSLCPSHPDARAFAVALTRDVTDHYDVMGVSLETPGFLPYQHGYHHEFSLFRHNRWLDNLLGLCFCDHCVAGAKQAGIAADKLKLSVAKDIGDYLASDVDFPDDMAEAFWLADTRNSGELRAFLDYRCGVVSSLIAEIRARVDRAKVVSIIPSVARPTGGAWYEGSDLAAIAASTGIIEACFYEPGANRVKSDLYDIKRRTKGQATIRGIMRPAHPDFANRGEFLAAAKFLIDGGVKDLAFYNYGHIRRSNLDWIGDVTKML